MIDRERYRVLHAVADEVVADLQRDFEVSLAEGLDVDAELGARYPDCLRVVRLAPAMAEAAPVTIAWTSFPGLHVRLGRWHMEAYPQCGCDDCDEDPVDLIEAFRRDVAAVAGGGFEEAFDGQWLHARFEYPDGGRRSSGQLRDQAPAGPAVYTWAAWPRALGH